MKTLRQLEIEDDIRSRHKGMMSLKDVGEEIGVQNRLSILRFLGGLPCYNINGLNKWRPTDVARRIAELEVRSE